MIDAEEIDPGATLGERAREAYRVFDLLSSGYTPTDSDLAGAPLIENQRIRKRIEEAFGWMKSVAGQHKTKFA